MFTVLFTANERQKKKRKVQVKNRESTVGKKIFVCNCSHLAIKTELLLRTHFAFKPSKTIGLSEPFIRRCWGKKSQPKQRKKSENGKMKKNYYTGCFF